MNKPQSEPIWIIIKGTPHSNQRYDTCGDWYNSPGAGLVIKVSQELSRKEQFLVAIHELIEAFLCECAGISEAAVDRFDRDEARWQAVEPGDMVQAPYYKQHQIATGIEKILAAEVGVGWLEYENHCNELEYLDEKSNS